MKLIVVVLTFVLILNSLAGTCYFGSNTLSNGVLSNAPKMCELPRPCKVSCSSFPLTKSCPHSFTAQIPSSLFDKAGCSNSQPCDCMSVGKHLSNKLTGSVTVSDYSEGVNKYANMCHQHCFNLPQPQLKVQGPKLAPPKKVQKHKKHKKHIKHIKHAKKTKKFTGFHFPRILEEEIEEFENEEF